MIEDIVIEGGEVSNESLLAIGKGITREVAREARANRETLGNLTGETNSGTDQVKVGDKIADEVLSDLRGSMLERGLGPVYVYSEEGGVYALIDKGNYGVFLVIDPIDGSNNMVLGAGKPMVSTSVALGRISDLPLGNTFDPISVAVVRDIFGNWEYSTERGRGSTKTEDLSDGYTKDVVLYAADGSRINKASARRVVEATIGIDMDAGKFDITDKDELDKRQKEMGKRVYDLANLQKDKFCERRIGSSILDFCEILSSSYSAFVSLGGRMKLHDLAAAKLLIEEAGGTFQSNKPYPGNLLHDSFELMKDGKSKEAIDQLGKAKFKVVASANPILHDDIMSYVGHMMQ